MDQNIGIRNKTKYMIFENITLLKPRKYLTIMATN